MSPSFSLKRILKTKHGQLKEFITKLNLSYMLADYFKFGMSFELRVSKFITILRGFQVENE